ncbi:MAG: hypothetical protein ABIP31_01005 [Chitinophagaceae bacterium]
MLFNQADIDNEIRELHFKIIAKRKAYDEGMKQDMVFEELKKLFLQIKDLEKRLELCFQESNAQRENY